MTADNSPLTTIAGRHDPAQIGTAGGNSESKPSKPRRIPKKIVQAIELLLSGECDTQKAAAHRVNVTPEWLSKMLQRDYVRVFFERRIRQTIGAGTIRAAARLNVLMDANSEHVSLDAVKHALGIVGIKPAAEPQISVNVEMRAGYVIDLSERDEVAAPKLRLVEGKSDEV